MTPKQRNHVIDAEWTPVPPRKPTRNELKRATRRDVILAAVALIVIPICTAYLVNYIVPTVYF